MTSVDGFTRKIEYFRAEIQRALTNIKKTPKDRISRSYLDIKRKLADELWSGYRLAVSEAHASLTKEEIGKIECLKESNLDSVEVTYIDLTNWIDSNSIGQSNTNSRFDNPVPVVGSKEVLKPLSLPNFDGDFRSWSTFHDLFISLVHNNKNLTKVQKLQYLKSATEKEAKGLLAPYAVTEANYDDAWALMLRVYNNRRLLVDGQLDILFGLEPVTTESATDLKHLIYATDQVLKSLKNSGIITTNWDYFIIHLTSRKLPPETRSLWEQEIAGEVDLPKFEQFLTFVEKRYRSLMTVGSTRSVSSPVASKLKSSVSKHKPTGCPACKEDHDLDRCTKFVAMDLNRRWSLVKKSFICFHCLKAEHKVVSCKLQTKCIYCARNHHALLHDSSEKAISKSGSPKATEKLVHYTTSENENEKEKVFATALVNVRTNDGSILTLRAIIDPTSNSCFITNKACQLLKKLLEGVETTLTGLGGKILGSSAGSVSFGISSIYDSETICDVTALVVQSVSNKQPSRPLSELEQWNGIKKLRLADPMFHAPGEIDVLLDVEVFSVIIRSGLMKTPGCPNVHETSLGWIVLGVAGQSGNVIQSKPKDVFLTSVAIERQLRAFWEQEECVKEKLVSPEDELCEKFFTETTKRTEDGRFVVRLKMKNNFGEDCILGESRKMAYSRFKSLESRLDKDSNLRQRYRDCLNEYFEMGQIERCGPTAENAYYIPHHAVTKTGKFRVVFDASCRTDSGLSLNDAMYSGPKLQTDLCVVINNWRRYRFSFQSDIEKMYRQIEVSKEDANCQRILWRVREDSPIEEFQLSRLTFGVKAAPYLAIRTLHMLADGEKVRFPKAQHAVKNELYVDDLRSGGDTIEEAIEMREQVSELLESGRFPLRKWVANDSRILIDVPSEHMGECGQLDIREEDSQFVVKSFGLLWDPKKDVFRFHINEVTPCVKLTKRTLLSKIAGLYDPMGWISHVIVRAKILMQGLWELNCDWDELVPKDIEKEWLAMESSLSDLKEISIPSDACCKALAAVVYLRVVDEGNNIFVHLISSKSKVAPLRTVTLPRLQLCGAVLAAELSQSICESMKLEKKNSFFWSDSEITLAWIMKSPQKWTTYVANRVSSIQSKSEKGMWSYVRSKENPADCCSRGILPQALVGQSLWWSGPTWLCKPESEWPKRHNKFETDLEMKHKTVFLASPGSSIEFANSYSTLRTAVRVVAWMLKWRVPIEFRESALSVADLKYALVIMVRQTQSIFFDRGINLLRCNKGSELKSNIDRSLSKLSPFLDAHGILRVGGRIRHSQLSFNKKHPIILPKNGHLTQLVIRNAHESTLHGSIQETLRYVRNTFWVSGGRNTVQRELISCVNCNRIKARLCTEIMADLPVQRVASEGYTFNHTGLDYAGPFVYRASTLRKAQRLKCYVALFICFNTRAVSLQLVTGKSTDAFMKAFVRFTSTRGKPSVMYSDNEPAFVGASRFMEKEWWEGLRKAHEEAKDLLSNDGINWLFNPPEAPHQGGLWELNIKAMKRHLLASIGSALLTYEELSTVLAKIEACLNYRPLCALSEDSEDFEVLTPGHFLVGRSLLSVPESIVLHLRENVLTRWRYLQKLSQTFWQQWSHEYLVTLQKRNKWCHKGRELKVGDLVLLQENMIHPLKWRRGRIIEAIIGRDSNVRVVKVKTMSSVLTRDVRKVCLLLSEQGSNRAPVDEVSKSS